MIARPEVCSMSPISRSDRADRWAIALPIGLTVFTIGFAGSAVAITAGSQEGVVASVVVIVVGTVVAVLGGALGVIPRYVRSVHGSDRPDARGPGDDGGWGGSRVPAPSWAPPGAGGSPWAVDDEPTWWLEFEQGMNRWLFEGAPPRVPPEPAQR